jgi:hypothetical protein
MSPDTVRQLLKEEIDTLPDTLAESVFDFVLFLKARHHEEVALWQEVEATHAYRQEHPEDIQTVTAQEWEQATAHLEQADELPSQI